MGDGISEVYFPAYCMAFSALDEELSERICRGLQEAEDTTSRIMYRTNEGDGLVYVSSFRNNRLVTWHGLSQEGEIKRGTGGNITHKEDIDPIVARYFIAGAFGVDEIYGDIFPDETIVDGIHNLYKVCIKKDTACLRSQAAWDLSREWEDVYGAKKEYEEKLQNARNLVVQIYDQLNLYLRTAKNRSELEAKLSSYRLAMPSSPVTVEDYNRIRDLLRQMNVIAKMHLKEERGKRDFEEMKNSTPHYNDEARRVLLQTVKEESSDDFRFTSALEAGFECMPVGSSVTERYCLAQNRFNMASMILKSLRQFNNNPCVKWSHEIEKSIWADAPEGENEEAPECIEHEYDSQLFQRDALMKKAKSFCTTECK